MASRKSSAASIPTFQTGTSRPAVATTGFLILDNGDVVAMGISKEHMEGLLRSQDPLAKVSVKKATAKSLAALDHSKVRTISGRQLTSESIKRAVQAGGAVASGPQAQLLLQSAVKTFTDLRKIDLKAVFIDHDV